MGRLSRPLRFQVLGHHRAKVEGTARRGQQRRYPDDWVGQVVDGTAPCADAAAPRCNRAPAITGAACSGPSVASGYGTVHL